MNTLENEIRKLHDFLDEVDPHEHYEGMNECPICDEYLSDSVKRIVNNLRQQLSDTKEELAKYKCPININSASCSAGTCHACLVANLKYTKAELEAANQHAESCGTNSAQFRAELYDEVRNKAKSMGYANVTDALISLEAANQRQQEAINKAVAEERERCAKIADHLAEQAAINYERKKVSIFKQLARIIRGE